MGWEVFVHSLGASRIINLEGVVRTYRVYYLLAPLLGCKGLVLG